jgi:hypothetical protein
MAAATERDEMELDEFVSFFFAQRDPWVLWLGSSISIEEPSRIPSADAMLDALLDEMSEGDEPGVPEAGLRLARAHRLLARGGEFALRKQVGPSVPFEIALGQVWDHTDPFVPTYLEKITPRDARPNPNHLAAAVLALGSASSPARVRLIVTTNFDECLEGAARSRIAVSVPKQGAFPILPAPGLLKLHGTISDRSSLGATPAALAQRDSREWRDSLVQCLGTSNVLFVGYSFSDTFDITPALVEAEANGARFYWMCLRDNCPPTPPVNVHRIIFHDLREANGNVLRRLAPTTGAPMPVWPDQMEIARWGCRDVQRQLNLPVARKLAAFGALFYWIERGEESLRYFLLSSRCPGSQVNPHVLATASSRARRFRAAVRWFERMLDTDLPAGRRASVRDEIDWHVGAGFCASTGGRPMVAARHYRKAREAFNRAKRAGWLTEEDLGPHLADQLLRSQAGEQIRMARWHPRHRARHLDRAASYLDRLEAIGGLALATKPLLPLERARLELTRGNRAAALGYVEQAEQRLDQLRDPHAITVCRRLRATALGDRSILATAAVEARQDGRRIEWAKIQAERLGLDGYGTGATITYAARCLFLATVDLVKDWLRPVK